MRQSTWVLLSLLAACTGSPGGEDGLAGDSDSTGSTLEFTGAALEALTDGECPKLKSGTRTFSSNGKQRTVVLEVPKDVGPGAPVVFVWHGLGDSAESMHSWMDLEAFSKDNDAIVVVPDSQDRNFQTWNIFTGGDDLAVYDDLRTCLAQELDVDLGRVSTTGFSFGALWTSYLTVHRSDTFAASMPMSGGVGPLLVQYSTPAYALPVLLMWGGASDTFGAGITAVDFEDATLEFSDELQDDGHLVVHCNHNGGHTVPFDLDTFAADWLLSHTYGQPSPFEGDDLSGFPSYCSWP